MLLAFANQTAVVTGGANGIGLATAQRLAQSGAAVTIFDLPREDPAAVAASFGATGVALDVTDATALAAALERLARIDVVVINAGTARMAPLLATSAADWDATLALNLTAAFHTLKLAAARMQAHGGAIVLTASTNSYDGERDLTAYNASKAGLLGLVHTAANELGPHRIRVNAVCPGMIRTRLAESMFRDEPMARAYFREVPLGRGGTPEEVANAITFLASDAAAYVTGATLLVDGGQMASKFGPWNDEIGVFDARTAEWRRRSRPG